MIFVFGFLVNMMHDLNEKSFLFLFEQYCKDFLFFILQIIEKIIKEKILWKVRDVSSIFLLWQLGHSIQAF